MKKISIILISIVLLLLASSCDGQVFSELMDTETQTIDYTTVPLTLEFTANGTLSFVIPENIQRNLQYSKNGGEKTAYTDSIPVVEGDVVQLYAVGADQNYSDYLTINPTSDCYVYGNVMSLLDPDNFATNKTITKSYALYGLFMGNAKIKNHETKKLILPATTLVDYCYAYMFYGCTGLTKAPELPATTLADNCYFDMFYGCTNLTEAPELLATTLAKNCYRSMFYGCTSLKVAPELPATTLAINCYFGMFHGCTSLTKAPELPATTLADYCYADMFSECTGLTTAPKLPATTLAEYCYSYMFIGCTGLEEAPELPATTLADFCYYQMFYGCSSLNSVTCLATDISASNCTTDWLNVVASSGTFTKASGTDWPRTVSGIPSGWTIKEDPLTLEFTANGTLSFTNPRDSLQYSKNGEEKKAYSDPIPVVAGDVVQLYAEAAEQTSDNYLTIICTSDCYVYGNVMSLLDPEDYATNTTITTSYALNGLFENNTYIKIHETKKLILPATILADHCYTVMFYGCTGLTKAPELPATSLSLSCYSYMFGGCKGLTEAPKLPATTLANYCYLGMFNGCTGLTEAPELTATSLSLSCYDGMFYGCTGLTKAPELPATTLASSCYAGMFQNCTSLTTAPELPAASFVDYCYYRMFKGCTSLNSVTCLATGIPTFTCTYDWLDGVASSGTFTKASSMTGWTEGPSGIPSGWTPVDKQ